MTTLTCDGGVNVLLLNQQVSGALWEPGQHHELDEGWNHHHGEEQGPVFILRNHLQSVVKSASQTHIQRRNFLHDLSEELVKTEDLRQEDAGADEDARDQTQEASQVLWRDLTQVHGYDTERDSCSERTKF